MPTGPGAQRARSAAAGRGLGRGARPRAPAPLVAAGDRGWRRRRRRPGPPCWRPRAGRPLRADYTLLESASRAAAGLAPGGRGVAVRADPERVGHRARARAGRGRRRGSRSAAPERLRGFARLRRASRCAGPAARPLDGALEGLATLAEASAADALVGLGRGRARAPSCRPLPRRCCAPSWARTRRSRRAVRARGRAAAGSPRCPRPARARARGRASGADDVRDGPRDARAARRRQAATPTWCACARATPRARPTPWWSPGSARRGARRCWRACAEAGVAVVPVRRRHERGRRGGAAPRRPFDAVVALDLAPAGPRSSTSTSAR